MILLHRHKFGVTSYHKRAGFGVDQELSAGLVVPVRLTFEHWLDGQTCDAEAFLDPGADNTIISARWMADQAKNQRVLPRLAPGGYINENIDIEIGSKIFELGDATRRIWIRDQNADSEDFYTMPGYEDLLLGRDFLTQHGLLLVIDGSERSVSLLYPDDDDNLKRRQAIYAALAADNDAVDSSGR